jgi:DNA polymerase III subunit epsilon
LVAHNARFDYGFIKNEFKRFDQKFTAKCLCTVRLSQSLYPRYRSHNLDAVMKRFGFVCQARHRAFDDAKVLWDFLQHCQKEFSEAKFTKAIEGILKSSAVPPLLPSKVIETLPEGPGVYLFYGPEGSLLYVGKSVNVKDRVKSHFSGDYRSSKEMGLCQQVAHVEAIETAGELGALLLESHLIKTKLPLYNRLSRVSRRLVVLEYNEHETGLPSVSLKYLEKIMPVELPKIFGVFRSFDQAKGWLKEAAKQYELCPKFLNLEKQSGPCFGFYLKQCRGVCRGDADSEYALRFTQAFTERKIADWPFSHPIVIEEKKDFEDSGEAFIIDKWCLLGAYAYDEAGVQDFLKKPDESYQFDYDGYKILSRYIKTPGKHVNIRPLKLEELRSLQSLS